MTVDLSFPLLLLSIVLNFFAGGHLVMSKLEEIYGRRESRGEVGEEGLRKRERGNIQKREKEIDYVVQLTDLHGQFY